MMNLKENTKSQDGNCYLTNEILNTKFHEYLVYGHGCRTIFNHYGIRVQKKQLIQELGELIVALTKSDLENIIEEMADVQVMLDQFKFCNEDFDSRVENVKFEKVKRQLQRIQNENNRG